MKLSDLSVRNLTHDGTQKTHHDDALPNFGIRVGKRRKTWMVLVGTERQRITIGHYPSMGLKEARAAAIELLSSNHTVSPTFEEALEQYCRQHLIPNTKPGTAREVERALRHHFSHLGRTKLDQVTAHDVFQVVDALSKTPAAANTAFQVMRTFLNWAASKQLLEKNPIEKARKPFKKNERDRVLTDDELAEILRATNDGSHFSRIAQLLIYTAQRRTEIGALRWEYINERDRTITWPKAAIKSARQHVLPYTDAIQKILAGIPRTSPFLFPSLNPDTPFSQWSLGMRELRAACDIPMHFQIHDFRRTAATNLARCGTPPHIVERILNHATGEIRGVAAVYNRWAYLEEMRNALDKYNQLIAAFGRSPKNLVGIATSTLNTEPAVRASANS